MERRDAPGEHRGEAERRTREDPERDVSRHREARHLVGGRVSLDRGRERAVHQRDERERDQGQREADGEPSTRSIRRGRLAHRLRSLTMILAALWPGAPITPPPGWAPEPHR